MTQHTPLSEAIPDWVVHHTRTRVCTECGKQYTRNDIRSFGLRESDGQRCDLYVEHRCPGCGHLSVTVFKNDDEASVEELCYSLLDHLRDQQIKKNSAHSDNHDRRKSKKAISDKDVHDFMQFVNKSKSHDEFMKKIGVPKNTKAAFKKHK